MYYIFTKNAHDESVSSDGLWPNTYIQYIVWKSYVPPSLLHSGTADENYFSFKIIMFVSRKTKDLPWFVSFFIF